jgi:hypothetical protein
MKAIGRNERLQFLDILFNEMGFDCLCALERSLKMNQTLSMHFVDENRIFDANVFTAFLMATADREERPRVCNLWEKRSI